MAVVCRITPCLWFDSQAEDAARCYTAIFPDSKIGQITYYGQAGQEIHGRPPGSVLTVAFELDGQPFTALNGGPMYQFTEAISLQVHCETQAEIDHYWNRLTAGSDPVTQQCGWLKDQFGLSWQVVPAILPKLLSDPDPQKTGRVMQALFPMQKLDIATLQRAYDGT